MITPRTTRLVRAADLRSFRRTLAALATEGLPLDARDRLIVVPTRAAAHHLLRSIENQLCQRSAVVLPDLVTRAELHFRLFDRLSPHAPLFTPQQREALLTVACRAAIDGGANPPFRVRPGLVSAMLDFFDSLKRHQKSVDDFQRLTLGRLDGAEHDRGAERLIRQTRFLAAAFREFERQCREAEGVDEHVMRARLVETPAQHPWRHVVIAVRDRAADRYGLYPVDWDLLARLPGLQRIDVVVTDATLAGSFHERIHQWLPGIEEVRADAVAPNQSVAAAGPLPPAACVVARDREEEVIGFARWVREEVASAAAVLDRTAIVVRQRLPYVYLARDVFRAIGVPCQMFDALPLAAEPYAAVVDAVFSCVSANFARVPAMALLRSPHLEFITDSRMLRLAEVAALDRALSEAGYLGGLEVLERLHAAWRADGARVSKAAVAGASVLEELARELQPLRADAPIADHLELVLTFLVGHEPVSIDCVTESDDPLRARQLRARSAILGLLRAVRDAYRRFDSTPVPFEHVAAIVRRQIDAQTFAPHTGASGVHLVDADSAPFGEFDYVQLAGLVDGEWPERPRRNIFYSPAILRDLGWPAESDRIDAARGAFCDLLRLADKQFVVSTFSLEHDAIVTPSALLDDAVGHVGAGLIRSSTDREMDEGLVLSDTARDWAAWRLERSADSATGGKTGGHTANGYAVSALERYQDCPFQFFAANVLQLDEVPEDEPSLSPRARGRFIHEVFQRFFERWDERGERTITSAHVDDARALFAEVAEPLLSTLPEADAALERTRLFGSAISVGIVDVVLGLEASRSADIVDRWLEYRLDGRFSLGLAGGRTVPLRGVADRVDLLSGKRLRVIDYKTGYPPQPKRALQVPIYALCAQERLAERGNGAWHVDEGAYVAFSGKRPVVSVIGARRDDQDAVLAGARARLLDIIDGIERGEFPARPYETRICSYCAYPSVCRKDYVGDE